MSSTQFLTDAATRHAVFLQRYASGSSKEATKLLMRLRRDINARLSQEPTIFQRERLEAVLFDINTLTTIGFKGIERGQIISSMDLVKTEAAFSTKLFNKAATIDFTLPQDATLVAAVMTSSMKLTANASAGVTIEGALQQFGLKKSKQIAQIIADGVTLGDTTPVISQKVGEIINTLQRRQLDSLVRTIANNVSSIARSQVYQANSDIIDGYQWVATLDSKTTFICFTGETSVVPLGGLENVFRRKYAGDMVTITTASGKKITGTPNHPVLTPSGWVSLDEIDPGKHIVYSPSFEAVGISGNDSVGMPTTFAKLYDSISDPTISDVQLKSTTAKDFHGDGQGGDGEVETLSVKGELRYWIKPSVHQGIKNKLLRFIHNCVFLLSGGLLNHHLFGGLPIAKPSKGYPSIAKNPIDGRFVSTDRRNNLGWSSPIVKHLENLANFFTRERVMLTSASAWHHSRLLEHIGDSGGRYAILPAQARGGLPIAVFSDNVVSKSVEFKSCHVYNLQSSLGLYIAGGILVKNCASRDGKTYIEGIGPMPPAHWNCVLGGTLITSAIGVSAIFKRVFKGEVVTINTISGNKLTVTPNHPVLTSKGWKPAKLLNVGDECVNQRGGEGVGSVDSDDNGGFVSAEEIFESFGRSGNVVSSKVEISSPDFHGDGVDNEVAEVRAASDLSIMQNTSISKHRGDCVLGSGNVPLIDPAGHSGGVTALLLEAPYAASSGDIGVLSDSDSIGFRSSIHSGLLLSAPAPESDSVFSEDSLNGTWTDAEHIRNAPDSYAGGVFFDDIVSIEVSNFSGHVYNLQTVDHCYSANGIITHNCRSTTIPKVKPEFDIGAKLKGKRPSVGDTGAKQVSSRTTYSGWLRKQPVEFIDEALGVEKSRLFRSGKLSLTKTGKGGFIDPTGRVYNLKQLKEMNSIALIEP